MNGEHNQRQPESIWWSEPRQDSAEPAWQGPSPDAPASEISGGYDTPAPNSTPQDGWGYRPQGWNDAAPEPRGDASAPGVAAPLGNPWDSPADAHHAPADQAPASPSSQGWAGAAGPGTTADEISHSHPDNAGFGWSGASGSSRFDAPDRGDHAARQEPVRDADAHDDDPRPRESAPRQSAREAQPVVRDAVASQAAPHAEHAPASYASAPNVGQTGADSYASAPAQQYASNPPQVVGHNDDLPDDSLTIGRSRSNSIVLDDMLVSRRHVVITADDEGLLLRDLGSRNGTFVNARRVEQTHLHEGDRIGIGASTFEVRDGWLVSV